uniref:Uncharacterized protein n=1 Tax=Oryza sativa subsp. japonica TaxID=39947 RepID=Q69UY8_ORYSJ|nr:hypothetical protein [Oryza sativa Japonica Group]
MDEFPRLLASPLFGLSWMLSGRGTSSGAGSAGAGHLSLPAVLSVRSSLCGVDGLR